MPDSSDSTVPPLRRPPTWAVVAILMVAEMTSAAEASMVYTALPTFYRLFGDPVGVGWLLSGFLLVSAGAAAVCSRLGDLYGRSRVMIGVLLAAASGSLFSALSSSLEMIVLGRAIQGVSGAILPLCYGLLRENLPAARVPVAVGVIAATATAGAGTCVLLGGVLIDHASWHWIFLTSFILATVGFLLVAFVLPASPRREAGARVDLAGGLLFMPAIGLPLLAIAKGASWGWSSPRVLALLGGGAILMMVWVWYERRHESPLIDVRLLATRQVGLTNLAFGLIAVGSIQLSQVLFLLLQQPVWTGVGLGIGALLAGVVKLPATFIGVVASPLGGRIAGRYGARSAMLLGTGVLALGCGAMAAQFSSVWFLSAMTLLTGFGLSMIYSAVPNLIIETTPTSRTSEANGITQVTRTVGMAVGSQFVTFLLATSTITDPTQGPGVYPDQQAFRLALGYLCLTAVLAMAVAFALPRRGRTAEQSVHQVA